MRYIISQIYKIYNRILIIVPFVLYNIFGIPFTMMFLFFNLIGFRKKKISNVLKRIGILNIPIYKDCDVVFIHIPSLGESIGAIPVIDRCLSKGEKVLVTNTTDSGREFISKKYGNQIISLFLPFDNIISILLFLRHFRIKSFILFESDLWPNLIWLLSRKKVKMLYINARISCASFKKWLLLKEIISFLLSKFESIYTFSNKDKEKIQSFYSNAIFCGNSKYNNITAQDSPLCEENVVLFENVHQKEYSVLIPIFEKLQDSNIKIIIVPRHVETKINESLLQIKNKDLLEIATEYGKMDFYRKKARIIVSCGSFVKGMRGHNILEPLSYLRFVLIGEYNLSINKIVDELKSENLIQITNVEDLFDNIINSLNSHNFDKIDKINGILKELSFDITKLDSFL